MSREDNDVSRVTYSLPEAENLLLSYTAWLLRRNDPSAEAIAAENLHARYADWLLLHSNDRLATALAAAITLVLHELSGLKEFDPR